MNPKQQKLLDLYLATGEEQHKDNLIQSLRPLVFHIYHQLTHNSGFYDEHMEDIIQAGYLGLYEALRRFNPILGELSTYAVYWIRRLMIREIEHQKRFSNKHLTTGDISTLDNITTDGSIPYVENKLFLEQFYTALTKVLPKLRQHHLTHNKGRSVEFFKAYYYDDMTLQDVANLENLTRERVRQLIKSIMTSVKLKFKDWQDVVLDYFNYLEQLNDDSFTLIYDDENI